MATLYSCFDFNPRSPHGERRIVLWMLFTLQKFQSTLPARGATAAKPIHDQMVVFQSTLPARGATCRSKKILLQRWIFQSTLPARGATVRPIIFAMTFLFQSTLPARGATVL